MPVLQPYRGRWEIKNDNKNLRRYGMSTINEKLYTILNALKWNKIEGSNNIPGMYYALESGVSPDGVYYLAEVVMVETPWVLALRMGTG